MTRPDIIRRHRRSAPGSSGGRPLGSPAVRAWVMALALFAAAPWFAPAQDPTPAGRPAAPAELPTPSQPAAVAPPSPATIPTEAAPPATSTGPGATTNANASTNEGSAIPAIAAPTAPEAPEAPQPPKRSSRRTSRTSQRDHVVIGTPVNVAAGESVRDVVAFGSRVQVNGTVDGDLVVLLGQVRLGPTAKIARELIVVGGSLDADPAARLGRKPIVVSPEALYAITNALPPVLATGGREWIQHALLKVRPLPLPQQSTWAWMVAGASLALYLVVGLLFAGTLRATGTALEERPGASFMTGLLGGFLTLPVLLLLLVTVVGSIAVPFVVIAIGAFALLGKVSVYQHTGRLLTGRLGNHRAGALLALALGTILFYGVYCVPVLGAVVWALVGTLGFGAVLLTVLGRSRPAPRESAAESGLGGGATSGAPVHPGGPIPVTMVSGVPAAGGAAAHPGVIALPRVGFWRRLLASLIDFMLVMMVLAALTRRPQWFPFVWIAYHLVFWIWRGTTVGGVLCRVRIVHLDGRPLGPGAAIVRLLAACFSLAMAGLGFFWAGWSAEKQSWHDQIAGTTVVRVPRGTPLL